MSPSNTTRRHSSCLNCHIAVFRGWLCWKCYRVVIVTFIVTFIGTSILQFIWTLIVRALRF